MTELLHLAEAAKQYIDVLQTQGKSSRTIYTYNRDLEQIQAFFGPDKPVNTITLPLIGRFLKSDELLKLSNGQDRKPQTVNKTIRVFRMMMQWLVQVGYLSELTLPKSIPMGRATKPL